MNVINMEKAESKVVIKKKTSVKSSSKTSIVVVSLIITMLFTYMGIDYFYYKVKLNEQITKVQLKSTNLKSHVTTKMTQFDKENKVQEAQVVAIQKPKPK